MRIDFEELVRQELMQEKFLPPKVKCMILERVRGMNVTQSLKTLASERFTGTSPRPLAF